MENTLIPITRLADARSLLRVAALLCFTWLAVQTVGAHAALTVSDQWLPLTSTDGSEPTARHEAASVVVGEYLYLIGGRDNRPVERFSTLTGQWENLGLAPIELHHMQPVVVGSKILVIGAFSCCYPREQSVAQIYEFDTQTLNWDVAGQMPSNRVRGSTATVVHEGRIYVLGGNTQGHDGGAVAWFDEYNPTTGEWQELADAPNARDHFSAVVVGQRLVAAAGRQSSMPNPSANAVVQTDIYDFVTGQWRSSTGIPTPRGGAVTIGYNNSVVVAGGEINTANMALNTVEAFDMDSEAWQSLPPMLTGRHGSGGGIIDRHLHMVSGASSLGGAEETASHEVLQLPVKNGLPEGGLNGGANSEPTGDDTDSVEGNRRGGGSIDLFFLFALLAATATAICIKAAFRPETH